MPCFYRVIETRVKVWENEKCCGNTSRRRAFPQLFRVLPNFHECFYNSIGTRRLCFLFILENTAAKKNKNYLFTSIIKMYILFVLAIIASTARATPVFLWIYRKTVLNQSACIALGYFLIRNNTQTVVTNMTHFGKQNSFNLTFRMFRHTSLEVTVWNRSNN